MDATCNSVSRLPSGRVAASTGSFHVALHAPPISRLCDVAKLDRPQIFKKTPCAADSKPAGRDVAKDMYDVGGIIQIDADAAALNVKLTGAEPAKRKTKWMPRATNPTCDVLWTVGPGVDGAVAHLGAAYEKQCYADI